MNMRKAKRFRGQRVRLFARPPVRQVGVQLVFLLPWNVRNVLEKGYALFCVRLNTSSVSLVL